MLSIRRNKIASAVRALILPPHLAKLSTAELSPARPSSKAHLINTLLGCNEKSQEYLEIGVRKGKTLSSVDCARRTGVEPAPQFDTNVIPRNTEIFFGTSDEFFQQLPGSSEFDLVFIDGLHTFEQTSRDITNTLRCLSDGGIVVVDDVWPRDSITADPDMLRAAAKKREFGINEPGWFGDVWKVIPWISSFEGLEVRLIGAKGKGTLIIWGDIRDGNFPSPDDFAMLPVATMFSEDFESVNYEVSDFSRVCRHYKKHLLTLG